MKVTIILIGNETFVYGNKLTEYPLSAPKLNEEKKVVSIVNNYNEELAVYKYENIISMQVIGSNNLRTTIFFDKKAHFVNHSSVNS